MEQPKEEAETRLNTPTLANAICQRVREWVKAQAPRLEADYHEYSELKIRIFAGEVAYLDDGTPFLNISIEETNATQELGGWFER